MKRKLLSVFLSLCMMLTLVPGALAAEPEPTPSEEGEITTQAALKNALTAAGSANNAGDKVVTLNGDIVLDNTGVAANSAAITVPEGVTLNGNGHTISVGKQWNGETKTHILSVENTQAETTTTIKNLTIVGSADTKSGIHAYNCTGTVKLEDVTIQNCGNAAVQVNSSKVEATNLNTEGNVWGAINVDKGASLDTSPSFTLNSGTLKEPTKIWTELANSSDNDDNSSKIISVPETWKEMKSDFDGKTYYANADDVAIWVGETAYATLQDAAKAAGENSSNVKTITLKGDITVTNQPKEGTLGVNEAAVTLPAGTSLDGQGHIITAIADWATGDNSKPKNHILGVNTPASDVTIKDVTIVGNESTKHGINAYANRTDTRTSVGKLTVENVTIQNCGTAGMVVQEALSSNLNTRTKSSENHLIWVIFGTFLFDYFSMGLGTISITAYLLHTEKQPWNTWIPRLFFTLQQPLPPQHRNHLVPFHRALRAGTIHDAGRSSLGPVTLLLAPAGLRDGLGVELCFLHELVGLFVGHFRDQLCNIHGLLLSFQPPVDLGGNLSVPVIQIIPRAGLGGEPPVNRHILLVHLADQGFIPFPQ